MGLAPFSAPGSPGRRMRPPASRSCSRAGSQTCRGSRRSRREARRSGAVGSNGGGSGSSGRRCRSAGSGRGGGCGGRRSAASPKATSPPRSAANRSCPGLGAEEVPGEDHTGGAEDSVVQVVPAVVSGCLHVCDQARRRRRQHIRALVVEPGLDQPEDDVATAQAARCPGCAATREDDCPARLMQLLRDLTAGLAAPDHEQLARRSAASLV